MREEDQIETSLQRAMTTATRAEGTRVSESMIQDIVKTGRRVRRLHRATSLAGSTVAASLLVTVGISVWDDIASTNQDRTVTTSTSAGTPSAESLAAWADALPRLSSSQLVVLSGTRLIMPERTVDIQGSDAGLVGRVASGYLIQVEIEERNPYSLRSELQIYSRDGYLATLPSSPYQAQGVLISPNGDQVAYGTQIFSLDENSFSEAIPDEAQVLEAWTDSGIIFSNGKGQYFLWSPGEAPKAMPEWPGASISVDGHGVRQQGDCSELTQVQADGTVDTLFDICDDDRLVAVSPVPTRVLTARLKVLTREGEEVTSFGPGSGMLANAASAAWLDGDSLAFTIAGPPSDKFASGDAKGMRSVEVVECHVESETCGRATNSLDVSVSDYVQIQ